MASPTEGKPLRDEQTLAKVLEAAYVIQERNRAMGKPARKPANEQSGLQESAPSVAAQRSQASPSAARSDSTFTLAQIAEIQHQIQLEHLQCDSVMSLVTERLVRIVPSGSAGIAILDGKNAQYRTASGPLALPAGSEMPMETALSFECLRTGKVFRCPDVNAELLVDNNECKRRGIQSMICVPVFHDGSVSGSLELYFPTLQAFSEEDVYACRLMAGLIGESLARHQKTTQMKSLADDRAAMLDVLEKLKPNLAALAETPGNKNSVARASSSVRPAGVPNFVCPKCRHELLAQEQFCGNCGLPRSSDYETSNMQSTIATLWQMQQQELNKSAHPATENGFAIKQRLEESASPVADAPSTGASDVAESEPLSQAYSDEQLDHDRADPQVTPEFAEAAESASHQLEVDDVDFEDSAPADLEIAASTDLEAASEIVSDDRETPPVTALAKTQRPVAWSSAATTREFLEQLTAAKHSGVWAQLWNSRRGDIYLAIAIILVLGVLRWGLSSGHPVNATAAPAPSATHHRPAPDADLSLFDRMLIKIGLAEAPDPPEYKGNPRTQVWVDLQTALYYCPGADLYGKTPKGKFRTQREAQLDQFEPAYRKACD